MTDVVATRPVTAALLAALQTTGIVIGDGKAPTDAGWGDAPRGSTFVPYAVLYGLVDGETDGTIESPNADGHSFYQVTSVGATREQAEWVADKTRAALLSSLPVASGRTIALVTLDMLSGAKPDNTVAPPVFMTVDRFDVLHTV